MRSNITVMPLLIDVESQDFIKNLECRLPTTWHPPQSHGFHRRQTHARVT